MEMLKKQVSASVTFKEGSDAGQFRCTFATMNVRDHDGDVTVPGAFRNGQAVRIAAWGHDWGSLPVGKGIIYADAQKAWCDGEFFLDTESGMQHYRTVKRLSEAGIQEWSYGFTVTLSDYGNWEGERVRFIRGVDCVEISPVMLGAGISTRTESIKGQSDSSKRSSIDTEQLVISAIGLATHYREVVRKDGRVLSAANRQSLTDLKNSLASVVSQIERLLSESDSGKSADGERLHIEYQRIRARLNGVTLE